jgi:2-C-methyl-D-erythritol 4-phosphate cytidylyltransferase
MTYDSTPIYVVIVAGGQGTRMGMALPKQFLPLNGKPILYYTIAAFAKALPKAQIILVLPESDISKLQMVLQHFEERIELNVVSGGATRFDSVKNGLQNLPQDAIILVHDGVRPFVSEELIKRCVHEAQQNGNAIPAIQVVDSIRVISAKASSPINRDLLRIVQTPQAFKGSLLLPAFEQAYQSNFTDEATVVEKMGYTINLVEGDKNNIKITTPEDLQIAELILQQKVVTNTQKQ